tara:strand:+ start:872 stop:1300 length:429 start_codon:yes stop_codon:yes gene_type:complete
MSEVKILKEKISSLQTIWNAQTNEYIKTYPEKKFGTNTTLNQRSFHNLVDTYSKMISFDAQLKGLSEGININLKNWDNKLVSLKGEMKNNKANLKNEYDSNIASNRLKTDKYNSNSESYITASFYILSLSTITFFIYKQLKQ